MKTDDEWWVNFIPEQESEVLKSSCAMLGIIGEDFESIYHLTAILRSFEKEDKHKRPTNKQRIDFIKNAINISNKLLPALDAIDVEDSYGALYKSRHSFDVELEKLQGSLRIALDALESESRFGRRAVLDEYATYIGDLWQRVEAKGFSLGRNNNFHKLCDAVFLAAGVPAKSEGALRRYLSKNV